MAWGKAGWSGFTRSRECLCTTDRMPAGEPPKLLSPTAVDQPGIREVAWGSQWLPKGRQMGM
jgi:hypothetical protein